jgi:quercetin dioxygenase-like cupin family protein
MNRLASLVMIGIGTGLTVTHAYADSMDQMKLLPDGSAAHWEAAPPVLPKGMMITMLSGDPSKPGPFTIRLTMPAGTVIAPHTHAQDENVTVISGDFFHGHDKTIDKNAGTEVHTGGFVFLPANHVHSLWTTSEAAVIQVTGTGPFGVQYVDPKDDPSKAGN